MFRRDNLTLVDFSRANLPFARIDEVDLTTCNFTRAFVRCFDHTRLGKNRFEQAFVAGWNGLDNKGRRYIERHGGRFSIDRPRLDRG